MGDSDRQESGVINVMSVNDELDQVLNGVIGEMLMISEMIMSTYVTADLSEQFIPSIYSIYFHLCSIHTLFRDVM